MSLASFISKEDFTPPAQTDVTYQPLDLASDVSVTHEPEVSDAEVSQQAILGQIAEHEEAVVAIEGFLELLRQNPKGIAAQTAQAIAIGLEQYQPLLGDEFKLMPGLEAFGGTMSRAEATNVSIEALSDTLSAAGGKLKELLNKLYEWALKFYGMVVDRVANQQETVKSMLQAVDKLPQAPATMMVNINSSEPLMVGNKFVGQDPSLLAGVASYAGTVYPRRMEKYMVALVNAVKNNTLDSLDETTPREALRGLDSTLPGNVVFKFSDSDAHSQKIEIVRQKAQPAGSVAVQVGRPADLKRRLNMLGSVLNEVVKVKGYPDQMKEYIPRLLGIHQLANGKDNVINAHVRDVITGLDEVLKYLVNTTQAYLAVINHEIKAYGQGRAE